MSVFITQGIWSEEHCKQYIYPSNSISIRVKNKIIPRLILFILVLNKVTDLLWHVKRCLTHWWFGGCVEVSSWCTKCDSSCSFLFILRFLINLRKKSGVTPKSFPKYQIVWKKSKKFLQVIKYLLIKYQIFWEKCVNLMGIF